MIVHSARKPGAVSIFYRDTQEGRPTARWLTYHRRTTHPGNRFGYFPDTVYVINFYQEGKLYNIIRYKSIHFRNSEFERLFRHRVGVIMPGTVWP